MSYKVLKWYQLQYNIFPITIFFTFLRGAVIILFLSTGDGFIDIKKYLIISSVFAMFIIFICSNICLIQNFT